MDENRVIKSITGIIAVLLMAGVIFIAGPDKFMDFPLFLFLWVFIGFAAKAAGDLISLITEAVTGKDHHDLIRFICCGAVTIITVIQAMYEKTHYFMGDLGASIIIWFLTLPLGVMTVVFLVKWIIHLREENRG